MLEPVKDMLRRQSLKKNASTEPTGFVPLDKIHSAVAFIDVQDTSFNECKNILQIFFREHNIIFDIFYFDFRELTKGERLITSIKTTVLKKDLNWYGKPSREKVDLMLAGEPDLFISLLPTVDYTLEFMATASRAHFKVGRVQLPGNTFDLVFKDPEDRKLSEAEVCKELIKFMGKIR